MILLEQFQGYYKNESQKENENKARDVALERKAKAVAHQQHELYTQQDMVKLVVIGKDREIDELR